MRFFEFIHSRLCDKDCFNLFYSTLVYTWIAEIGFLKCPGLQWNLIVCRYIEVMCFSFDWSEIAFWFHRCHRQNQVEASVDVFLKECFKTLFTPSLQFRFEKGSFLKGSAVFNPSKVQNIWNRSSSRMLDSGDNEASVI